MKVNKNVIMIKEDTKVGGMLLEAGDAFVRMNGRWTIVEAEDDAEDKKEDDEEKKVEEEDDKESDDDKMAALRAKKDESKK